MPRLKLVLDAGNGMGAVGAAAIFAHLPVDTVKIYFTSTATFPNHPADPLVEENRRDVMARVRAERADLGIAWDGDADRCFFIDDTGAFVPGDFVTALLGEMFCRREPGARIVYDVRASRAVADCVRPPAAFPWSTAWATPSSRSGCATRTPSSGARSRVTSTSGTTGSSTTA